MRAKEWFRPATMVLLGAMFATGCARPSDAPQGIAEAGDGAFTLSTRGPTAAAAVERGLNQASQHCADQNRMISVQSTRIERDGYNIAFRCLSVPGAPGVTRMAAAAPAAPAAVTAEPIVPATPAMAAAPVTAEPLATPAPMTAEPLAAPPSPPAAPAAVVAAPAAVPAQSVPPVAAPAARPVSPGGAPLPTASSPLPPIAGTGSPGVFSRPTPSVTPSSFWQAGR
jgi:hypothetical protein